MIVPSFPLFYLRLRLAFFGLFLSGPIKCWSTPKLFIADLYCSTNRDAVEKTVMQSDRLKELEELWGLLARSMEEGLLILRVT